MPHAFTAATLAQIRGPSPGVLSRGRSRASLADGLAPLFLSSSTSTPQAARALHGAAFPISEALKAPVFFDDGDLSDLPSAVCRQLEQAVRAVEEIPSLTRLSDDLSPCERLG